ncbi:MAG: hypothetical protein AMJ56_13050 [Anaerolineae bacterium SG8_19]|jgi:uncharacterized membrane protein YgcG|nr:MAG: hypothetical protein AMJ56_13050 [Anaerolineae bacterium SG8_19]
MTTRISDDQLDLAVSRLLHGDSPANILDSFPAEAADLRPILHVATTLETLRPVETPAVESLVSDRNDFLAQVTELQLQPVSPTPIVRLKDWISQQLSRSSSTSTPQQKEIRKMSALILKAALILVFAFGSLGGTLAAAADSLPDSAVYPLKLAMEQARLTFSNDPGEQAKMHLAFAQERTQEMVRLAAKGEVPEEALLTRMQTHMRTAYQLAAQAGEEQMQGLLTQARKMTQASGQDLEAAQEQVQERAQDRLQQASGMMFRWQQEAEAGLQDPGSFRWRFGPGGPCDAGDCEPPFGDGDQQQHQHGPGGPPCEGEECEPPYGDGDREQHQHGPGGPPCEGEDCEPPGDGKQQQNQYQHGPGAPPCQGEDCEPPGDGNQEQHQYGPGGPSCEGEDCEPPYGDGDQQQNQYQHGPGAPPCQGEDCEPPGDGKQQQNQYQHGPGAPPCEGEDCEPPGDGNQEQNQNQNTEQNQGQGDTQNQNQEQNGQGSNGQQSGGSVDSGGTDNTGGSDDSGGADDSGGSDNSGGSENSGGSNDSGGSGSSSGSGGGNGRG